MEKFVAGLAVLAALLAANVSLSEAQTEEKYFKAGGDVELSPQNVSEQIRSIVWKQEKNLLAEWAQGLIDLTYYSKFKGRSELNTTTGVLVIHNMNTGDTGVYSVEINNKVQSLVYQTVEVREVPRPAVDLQPLACTRSQTCGLKCHGNITGAEPVSYSWKKDDGEWEPSEAKKGLSDEEMNSVKNFYCKMKNPVSEKVSEAFKNPFYQEKEDMESSSAGPIVGGIIGGLLVVGILIGLGFWKRESIMKMFRGVKKDEASSPGDEKGENKPLNRNEPTSGGQDENELGSVTSAPTEPVKPSA